MATTVGATLTSSNLVVAQGDLHLVGSSVDQLIVHFDQAAYEEFLTTEQIWPNKAKKGHSRARAAISSVATPTSPADLKERSISAPADEPVPVEVQIHPSLDGKEIPGGPSCPQQRNNSAGHCPHRLG